MKQQEPTIYGEWEAIVGIDDVSETSGIDERVRLNEKQQAAFKLEYQNFLRIQSHERNTAKNS